MRAWCDWRLRSKSQCETSPQFTWFLLEGCWVVQTSSTSYLEEKEKLSHSRRKLALWKLLIFFSWEEEAEEREEGGALLFPNMEVTESRSQGAGHRETLNVVVTYFKYTEIHLSLFLHVFSYRDWSRSLTDVWQRRGVMVRRSLCWVWWPELRATGRRLLSFMRKLWTVTRTMKSTCVLCASCAWSCSESADAELELQAQDRRGCSWLIKCWFFPHVSVSLKAAFSHLCLCGDEEKRKLSRLWCIRVL